MSDFNARKEKEQLDKLSCEILRATVSVETFLDIYLSNYFCKLNRIYVFQNIIVGEKMSLNRKTQILNGIFKYEREIRKDKDVTQLDSKRIKEIINELNEIRETRNIVAHASAVNDGTSVYLVRNRGYITEKDRRRITPEYVKDFRKLVSKVLSGIQEIIDLIETG